MSIRDPKCCFDANTQVPYEMQQKLDARAFAAGCTRSDVVRDILFLWEEGVTYGEHIANHRRAVLSRKVISNPAAKASK